jgi:uncharacterized membrane protein
VVGSLALGPDERKRISDAIRAAEAGHRGEIVVHIEPRVFGDPLKRAAKLFADKGVDRTKDHTGVLLYVATATRTAAVWAGTGVKGGGDLETWKPVFDALGAAGDPTTKICAAIAALGTVLTERCAGADVHGNELGDGATS